MVRFVFAAGLLGLLDLRSAASVSVDRLASSLVRAETRTGSLDGDVLEEEEEVADEVEQEHEVLLSEEEDEEDEDEEDAESSAFGRQHVGDPLYECKAPAADPAKEVYTKLSEGLCKLDIPRRIEYPTEGRVCERMCTFNKKCKAYFTTQAEDCVHYFEKFIIPGKVPVDGGHCHKQVLKVHDTGARTKSYQNLGPGLCKMVPRLPEYLMCHNKTENNCETLCNSKSDCYGFTHLPKEDWCMLYKEADLRKGTGTHDGAKCFKKNEEVSTTTTTSSTAR